METTGGVRRREFYHLAHAPGRPPGSLTWNQWLSCFPPNPPPSHFSYPGVCVWSPSMCLQEQALCLIRCPFCRSMCNKCGQKNKYMILTTNIPEVRPGRRVGLRAALGCVPAPLYRYQITGISLSLLKQIDPSEQKTLANLPWIVEPGQEAKRGINTKYETTIF